MRRFVAVFALTTVLATGCNFTAFGDLKDDAPTRTLHMNGNRTGYGQVLTAYQGEFDGEAESRIAVSAGAGTEFFVFQAWRGDTLKLNAALDSSCDAGEIEDGECAASVSSSLVGLPQWKTRTMCLLVAAEDEGSVFVRCPDADLDEQFTDDDVEGFGASAAFVPPSGDDDLDALGDVLIGAPTTNGGDGALVPLPGGRELNAPAELDGSGAHIGQVLGATRFSDGRVLVASLDPETRRVHVLKIDLVGSAFVMTVHACIDEADSIHFAVPDEFHEPVLYVGDKEAGEVRLYAASTIPGAGNCEDEAWGVEQTVACPSDDLECNGSEFAASVSTGDLDGDGDADLLVGAPGAEIEGHAEAGAVVVVPFDDEYQEAEAAMLALSNPRGGDRLGTTVTSVRTVFGANGRDEPVAGVPGDDGVAVFLCSPLDNEDADSRCLP